MNAQCLCQGISRAELCQRLVAAIPQLCRACDLQPVESSPNHREADLPQEIRSDATARNRKPIR